MIQRLKEILKYDDGGFTVGKVQGIINRYGGGKSPLTADNYIEVSKNTGVPIDLLLAQGIVESNLGTKGMAVRTQNVGNVGNNGNTGKTTGQGNWVNGLYRMANLLKNEYKVQNQNDVQRMLDTNFLRPGRGGRYAEESNYASQVGKVLNTIRGGKFYGEPKSQTQTQQPTETQDGQTISISLPNYGTQQMLPDNPIGFDFGTLPKQFQNEIIENHRLQQEKANQEAEKSAIDKQNEVVQQELQRRQQERDRLLSTLPVLEHASLSPTRNNYTDLLKSATQQFQSGGLTKSQDEAISTDNPQHYKNRMDAYNLYNGLPQKNNTFGISPYRPNKSSDKNAIYYRVLDREGTFNDLLQSFKKPFGDLTIDNNVKKAGYDSRHNIMGNYTVSTGKDSKGNYMSYYDLWDLAPADYGKPFEIYDKFYYNKYKDKNGYDYIGEMFYNDNELSNMNIDSSKINIRDLQQELYQRGYDLSTSIKKEKGYNDSIRFDGVMGEGTRRALEKYKNDQKNKK